MFKGKRAEMGIGTLIIFIAMLLVAAVAAGVLIQTNAALQEKALTTGDQAKGQIATNVRVIEVSATDGSSGSSVDQFSYIIKLSPGSESIKLAQVLLTVNTYNTTTTLTYNSYATAHNNDCTNATNGYCTNATLGTGNFSVEYLQQGPNPVAGNLQRGDVVRLHFASPRAIGEDEQVRLNFIPKIGTPTLTEFITPEVISDERMYLYP